MSEATPFSVELDFPGQKPKEEFLIHKQFSIYMQTLLPSPTKHTHDSKPPPFQVRESTDTASLPGSKVPAILNYSDLHTSHLPGIPALVGPTAIEVLRAFRF